MTVLMVRAKVKEENVAEAQAAVEKVIEALEQNASFDGPAGKTTIDPQTHHTILDVYIGEAKDKKFNVLETFSQQKPADTQAVCDLKKNPNENKQYVIDVKT